MTIEHRYDAYTGTDVAHGVPASASVVMGLEPPRFCTRCGRRMIVQIVPDGWTASCSRHGVLDSTTTGARR